MQANALVTVIGHAQFGAFVIPELEPDGLNWLTARIQYSQIVPLTGIKPIDLKTLPLRPFLHWPLVDSDLKPVRIMSPFGRVAGSLQNGSSTLAATGTAPSPFKERVNGLSGSASDMAICDCIDKMSICHQTADRSEVFLALNFAEYRVSASYKAAGHNWTNVVFTSIFLVRSLDHTYRDYLAVRHLQTIWDVVARINLFVVEVSVIDPLFDENNNAGPRVRPDAGGIECFRPGAFYLYRGTRLGVSVSDEIAPDRRADHALFRRQMQMIKVAGLQQIHE